MSLRGIKQAIVDGVVQVFDSMICVVYIIIIDVRLMAVTALPPSCSAIPTLGGCGG